MIGLPPLAAGSHIGLFGGSFNPAHEGHLLVAKTALKRLALQRVLWMVSPGNPLKDGQDKPSLEARMAQSRAVIGHAPAVIVSDIEARMGTRYTVDTLAELLTRAPNARFVWIMGADSLANFHRWKEWRAIAASMPIAVIDRPGATLKAMSSPAGRYLARYRVDETDAALLANLKAPALVFLHGPRSSQSSTALRARKSL